MVVGRQPDVDAQSQLCACKMESGEDLLEVVLIFCSDAVVACIYWNSRRLRENVLCLLLR